MGYTIDRLIEGADFDQIEARTRAALAAHGFGVLTEIDISATLKAKLGKDSPRQVILGACNPQAAFEALTHEPRMGTMLPCNVVIRQTETGVEVNAIDPEAAFAPVANDAVKPVASRIRGLLAEALAEI